MKKALLTAILMGIALVVHAQTTFNLGGDISMYPAYKTAGASYYSENLNSTTKQNIIKYLKKKAGMNSMRVRLFVNPTATASDPSLVQDLNYVASLGADIKNEGLAFLLDIHYSDTWADPSHQTIPSTWTVQTNAALADSVYSYTKRVLQHLKAREATPDFVQIGNEVSYGMLWRNDNDRCYTSATTAAWARFYQFLKKGAEAVREETPNAQIIIHSERVGTPAVLLDFLKRLKNNSVDYDIIGLSYYPFWHNTLENLSNTLNTLKTNYPEKTVQIVETAYHYYPTGEYTEAPEGHCPWPATPEGQQQYVEDLCTLLAGHDNVTGLYWWGADENGKNNSLMTQWLNRGLWDNSTGRPLPALFSLQNFLTQKEEAVGILSRPAAANMEDTAIYTLSGQLVSTTLQPGIYIKKGKKYLKR